MAAHIKPLYNHCYLAIFLFVLSFFSDDTFAAYSTHQEVLTRLQSIEKDRETEKEAVFEELDELIALSKKHGWMESVVFALITKAEHSSFAGNFRISDEIVRDILENYKQHLTIELELRLLIVDLTVSDSLGDPVQNQAKRDKLIELSKFQTNKEEYGWLFFYVGQSYYESEQLIPAIKNLSIAYDTFLGAQVPNGLLLITSLLSSINDTLGNDDKAIGYARETIELSKTLDHPIIESIAWYDIASVYFRLKDYSKAEQAITASREVSAAANDTAGITWADFLLAEIKFDQKQYELSASIYERIIGEFSQYGELMESFESMIGAAHAYLSNDQIEKASTFIEQANAIASENELGYSRKSRYLTVLMLFAKVNKDYEKALNYATEINTLQEDMHNKAISLEAQRYQLSFETELKTKENQALKRENILISQVSKQQAQIKQSWMYLFLATAMLLVSLSYFLFKQIRLRNAYQSLANVDTLTKAPNRRAIINDSESHLNNLRNKTNLSNHIEGYSIALIDIDNFKNINDEYGHDVGDKVLTSFARACEKYLRNCDSYGRFGGEEWMLCVQTNQPEKLKTLFSEIRQEINKVKPEQIPKLQTITFSMGVSVVFKENNTALNEIIKHADKLLYAAKSEGKDRIIIEEIDF